jgi:hypothetical protein
MFEVVTRMVGAWVLATVALGLAGCASAGGGAPEAASAADVAPEPAAPVRKAFVPPTWPAKSYDDEQHGFSVHYPADFEQQPAQEGVLFTAASPMQAPRLDVTSGPVPGDGSLDAIAADLERNFAALGGGEAKVTAKKETVLRDEVTPAKELTLEWAFQGFPLQSSVVAVERAGALISVTVTGMQGTDIAELSDIAYTLHFDD